MAEKKIRKTKAEIDKNNIEEENDIYKIDIEPEEKNNKNVIKVIDDEEEIDEIFGNVNKWLAEDELEENVKQMLEEEQKQKRKKRLTKIEEGIKSSKKTKKRETTKTAKTRSPKTKEKTQTEETKIEKEEKIESIEENSGGIKINAENGMTEILLKNNQYKIELQKTEYNIYTDENETSYIIVRDPGLKIISESHYILIQKQDEDYEITTNQDFKVNYVIDNLTRRDKKVNFKLTNLTEIIANDNEIKFEIDEEKVIENNLEDNHTLVISEEDGKVFLPYTKEDIKREAEQKNNLKINEIIEEQYTLPLDKYKNSIKARFREGYNLMYKREGKSKISAILLGIELMFETNLHPAIIAACKTLEELDIYLDCLEDNELEKFSCFKIIYKSMPTIRKRTKMQEF